MKRGRGSRRRNPGHTGGPYRLLFLAVCLLFLFFALYAGKRLIGGEKTEEQTEQETERPVLQIYTGEENEEKVKCYNKVVTEVANKI